MGIKQPHKPKKIIDISQDLLDEVQRLCMENEY